MALDSLMDKWKHMDDVDKQYVYIGVLLGIAALAFLYYLGRSVDGLSWLFGEGTAYANETLNNAGDFIYE